MATEMEAAVGYYSYDDLLFHVSDLPFHLFENNDLFKTMERCVKEA